MSSCESDPARPDADGAPAPAGDADEPTQALTEQDRLRLLDEARALLRLNDTGRFIKPSLGQYPHQWNWDAAFIAIGLRHVNPARGRTEVRALLEGQWADGMVPHILYPDGGSDYFPTPEFWQSDAVARAPAFGTSGLTQPPLLATAVRLLHDDTESSEDSSAFVAEVYPKILAWHRWMHRARDPRGTGLLAIVHPWESGTDNAPRFAPAMEAIPDVRPPSYQRGDQAHVTLEERPVLGDYDRYMHLIGLYRGWRWDAATLHEQAPFLVQDVLFNAIAHRAERDLRALALELGEPTDEIDGWLVRRAEAVEARLWNEELGLYLDYDVRNAQPLRESSWTAFAPLFAGLASPERARRLVAHLDEPADFAPGRGTRYLLPSVAKSSARFEPRRYWCGPIWLNANWLIARGLRGYGYRRHAALLQRHGLALVRDAGFAEYYDPRDGSACGARGFSWSAALTLDLLLGGSASLLNGAR